MYNSIFHSIVVCDQWTSICPTKQCVVIEFQLLSNHVRLSNTDFTDDFYYMCVNETAHQKLRGYD